MPSPECRISRSNARLSSQCNENLEPTENMKNHLTATIVGLVLGLVCGMQAASAASVSTDQPDYAPGSTVIITGSGFSSGETVTLQVLHEIVSGANTTSTA